MVLAVGLYSFSVAAAAASVGVVSQESVGE